MPHGPSGQLHVRSRRAPMRRPSALAGSALASLLAGSLLAVAPSSAQALTASTVSATHRAAPPCTSVLAIKPLRGTNLRTTNTLPTSHGSVRCTLRIGRTGVSVRALQRSLRRCYRTRLMVTGYFGPGTRSVLRDVQRQEGLPSTGEYDRATALNLRHAPACTRLT